MITLNASQTIQGLAGTATAITYTITGLESGSSRTYKVLAQGQLGTSNGTLYTAPALNNSLIERIALVNATGSDVTGVVISINGSAATNKIIPGWTIPAGCTLILNRSGANMVDMVGGILTNRNDVFDNTVAANVTPGSLSSSGSAEIASRRDHTHNGPGGLTSLVGDIAGANTEVVIINCSIPIGFLTVGGTYRIQIFGQISAGNTANSIFRVRLGATTLTGNIPTSVTISVLNGAAAGNFTVDVLLTIRSTGSSGTVIAEMTALGNTAGQPFNPPVGMAGTVATVVVNTTVVNLLELTYISGNASNGATVSVGAIERVKL